MSKEKFIVLKWTEIPSLTKIYPPDHKFKIWECNKILNVINDHDIEGYKYSHAFTPLNSLCFVFKRKNFLERIFNL